MEPVPIHVLSKMADYDISVGGLINQLSVKTSHIYSRVRALNLKYIQTIKNILEFEKLVRTDVITTDYSFPDLCAKYGLERGIPLYLCYQFEDTNILISDHIDKLTDFIYYIDTNPFTIPDSDVVGTPFLLLVYQITLTLLINEDVNINGHLIVELFTQLHTNKISLYAASAENRSFYQVARDIIIPESDIFLKTVKATRTLNELLCIFKYAIQSFFESTNPTDLLTEVVLKINSFGVIKSEKYKDMISYFAAYVSQKLFDIKTGRVPVDRINRLANELLITEN
jgi:hypothetical protein